MGGNKPMTSLSRALIISLMGIIFVSGLALMLGISPSDFLPRPVENQEVVENALNQVSVFYEETVTIKELQTNLAPAKGWEDTCYATVEIRDDVGVVRHYLYTYIEDSIVLKKGQCTKSKVGDKITVKVWKQITYSVDRQNPNLP